MGRGGNLLYSPEMIANDLSHALKGVNFNLAWKAYLNANLEQQLSSLQEIIEFGVKDQLRKIISDSETLELVYNQQYVSVIVNDLQNSLQPPIRNTDFKEQLFLSCQAASPMYDNLLVSSFVNRGDVTLYNGDRQSDFYAGLTPGEAIAKQAKHIQQFPFLKDKLLEKGLINDYCSQKVLASLYSDNLNQRLALLAGEEINRELFLKNSIQSAKQLNVRKRLTGSEWEKDIIQDCFYRVPDYQEISVKSGLNVWLSQLPLASKFPRQQLIEDIFQASNARFYALTR